MDLPLLESAMPVTPRSGTLVHELALLSPFAEVVTGEKDLRLLLSLSGSYTLFGS